MCYNKDAPREDREPKREQKKKDEVETMFNTNDARKNVATYTESLRAEKEAEALAWVENTALEEIKKESSNGGTHCRVSCEGFCGERLRLAAKKLSELGFSVSYNSKYNHLYITW